MYHSLILLVISWGFAALAWPLEVPGLEQSEHVREPFVFDEAARSFLNVPYLDDARDTLSENRNRKHGAFLEYRTRINVYVPPGDGPFPAILFVHGGAYAEGSMYPRPNHWAIKGRRADGMAMALKRGYVVIGVNYILGGGIHPQVQRDFNELIRHLRANAVEYSIDPNRIAAIGSSAGGWLVGSAGLTTADHFGVGSGLKALHLRDWAANREQTWGLFYRQRQDRNYHEYGPFLLTSFDEPEPRHDTVSSRMNAAVFDFWHQRQATSPDDPAICTFYGLEYDASEREAELAATGIRFSLVELSQENSRGDRTFHLPEPDQLVTSADGNGTVTLNERWLQFVDEHLRSPEAKTPAAEARPNRRLFDEPLEVTFATAAPGTSVHYTLDGSDPTTDSPMADAPITLRETTTVRFISVFSGMQPSGITEAIFVNETPLPVIEGPEQLPLARVGEPYEIQFSANNAVVWWVNCQHRGGRHGWGTVPKPERFKERPGYQERRDFLAQGFTMAIGLAFDMETGHLHGTPTRAGTFVIQVCAASQPNAPAAHRTWVLSVQPE